MSSFFKIQLTSLPQFRVYNVTIPEQEKNDFKAVCARLMNQYPNELAEGSLSKVDFRNIQIRHFNTWCEKAYQKKSPVRYIGLQVNY